ncbi:MAG: TIGR02253 family HAD-type hydrolase [Lentisphaeria bacterium]|jgi:putative hydrolase of the HAD superfamily|nr:TIGR02253 family HAD-type hydrolase [Lentisphaeria bacterium]
MNHEAVIFDIDDTLYNSTRLSVMARANAIEAMIDAGLPVDRQSGTELLNGVIQRLGANSNRHLDELVEAAGVPPSARLVAAGIVAYHNTKPVYLRPFEETIPTLLRLRDLGYRLGVITNGMAVKQWEKLIRLGIQHFFHTAVVSETMGVEKPDPRIFTVCCERLQVEPAASVYVGNDPGTDIFGANRVGMLSIRMRKGKHADVEPEDDAHRAAHDIHRLGDLLGLIEAGAIGLPAAPAPQP